MQGVWENYWYKSIDARQYAALRIAFGGLSAIYLLGLLPYVETQFSGSGWLSDIQQITIQNGGSWSLFFIQTGGHAAMMAYAVVTVGIVSAFLLMLGWHSQVTACITWLVWVSLWNRNPLLLDGDDAVLKVMCFYLMLSPCGNCWSVDGWSNKKPQHVAVWPLRLIQFQVALIYFVSGWVKFYSDEWLDGSIMQYVLIHPHYSRWDGWAIIDKPLITGILAGLAEFIRWWELLFPLLLINAYTRKLSILIGILFHVGLLLTMNLRWFAVIMLSLYPALMSNSCFLRVEEKLLKYFPLAGKAQ
ncbi:HTTM domain-containing protein [Methyloglobulus sp.]|uniref:HTTM domain-containing protein n=1 Tax=Methyloglobulus sp. TaxID=2518622 RepID=UPI00398904CC